MLVLSDLHLEFAPFEPVPDLEFDVVILAGDIHSPVKRAVQWAVDRFRGKPVVYLLGNHEYYDGRLDTTLAEARRGS
ncbi:metallophosphoesterase [Variovorax sp. W2I14]|uniref:metallophosphoesterase n=1 Tax=Variovorax sp. W2I14 TaxID=3042290 RepID=UPI003D250B42